MATGFGKDGEMRIVLKVKDDGSAVIEKFGDQADKNAKKSSKAFDDFSSGAGLSFKSVAMYAGIAAAAVAAGAVAMVKHQIDVADQALKTSQKVGTTVEHYTGLAYAAELAGVGNEKLAQSLQMLTTNLSDAVQGVGEGRYAIADLGLDAKKLAAMKPEHAIEAIADALERVPNAHDRARIAADLFGRSNVDMVNVLKGGKEALRAAIEEAQRMGVVISTDTAKAAEEFNDNLSRLKANTVGLANSIMEKALPALLQLTDAMLGNKTAGLRHELKGLEDLLADPNRFLWGGALSEKEIARTKARIQEIKLELELREFPNPFLAPKQEAGPVVTPNSRLREQAAKDQAELAKEYAALRQKIMDEQTALAEEYVANWIRLGELRNKNIIKSDEDLHLVRSQLAARYEQQISEEDFKRRSEHVAELAQKMYDMQAGYASENAEKQLAFETELERRRFEQKLLDIENFRIEQLGNKQVWDQLEREAEEEHQEKLRQIQLNGLSALAQQQYAANKARSDMWQAAWKGDLASMGGVMGEMSALMDSKSRTMFRIGKTAAIAQAAISGGLAIQNALATVPFYPLGLAMAALAAVQTGINIQRIKSIEFGGQAAAAPVFSANPNTGLPSGAGGSGGAAGGATTPPPAGGQGSGSQTVVNVIVHGNVVNMDQLFDEHIAPLLHDRINNRDMTFIGRNSRQAAELTS